jgi:hypothetical protein
MCCGRYEGLNPDNKPLRYCMPVGVDWKSVVMEVIPLLLYLWVTSGAEKGKMCGRPSLGRNSAIHIKIADDIEATALSRDLPHENVKFSRTPFSVMRTPSSKGGSVGRARFRLSLHSRRASPSRIDTMHTLHQNGGVRVEHDVHSRKEDVYLTIVSSCLEPERI